MAAPESDLTPGDIPSMEELIKPAEDVMGAKSSTDEAYNPDFNPRHPSQGSDTVDTSQDLVASEEAGVLQEPLQLDTVRPESSNQPHTAIGRHDNLETRDGGKERQDVEETSFEGGTQRDGEGGKEMLDGVSGTPANDEQTGQPSGSAPEEPRGRVEPSNSAPEKPRGQVEPSDSRPEEPREQVEPSDSASEEPSGQLEPSDSAPEEPRGEVEPSESAPEEPRGQVKSPDSAPEGPRGQVEPPDLAPEELREEQVKPPKSAPDKPKEQVEPPDSSPEEEEVESAPEELEDSIPKGQVEPPDSAPEEPKVEEQKEPDDTIPENLFYDYNHICSEPFVTPNSGVPSNVLNMLHSFGYDCTRRANLHLLDDRTLLYVAGTVTVIVTLKPPAQRYLRSSSGGGIGAVSVHPSKKYFAVAEKGKKPNIVIYEYPSLKPYRILRGGTMEAYAFVDFNASGTLLASVGSNPDFMLTLWDWKQENIMLRSKAFSQDVFQVTFSPENEEQLTTCGTGHIKVGPPAVVDDRGAVDGPMLAEKVVNREILVHRAADPLLRSTLEELRGAADCCLVDVCVSSSCVESAGALTEPAEQGRCSEEEVHPPLSTGWKTQFGTAFPPLALRLPLVLFQGFCVGDRYAFLLLLELRALHFLYGPLWATGSSLSCCALPALQEIIFRDAG